MFGSFVSAHIHFNVTELDIFPTSASVYPCKHGRQWCHQARAWKNHSRDEFICIRANESSFVNLLDWITSCFSFACTHKEVVCSSLMPDRSFSCTLLLCPGHCMLVKVLGIIFLCTERFLCTVKFSLYTVTRVATTRSALRNFGVQMPLQRFSVNFVFRWISFFHT